MRVDFLQAQDAAAAAWAPDRAGRRAVARTAVGTDGEAAAEDDEVEASEASRTAAVVLAASRADVAVPRDADHARLGRAVGAAERRGLDRREDFAGDAAFESLELRARRALEDLDEVEGVEFQNRAAGLQARLENEVDGKDDSIEQEEAVS